MQHNEHEAVLRQDRQDLIQLLRMRFGANAISSEMMESIEQLANPETIERLILLVVNTDDIASFANELQLAKEAME